MINISSIVASTGFNALSVYAATKASLVGFTKSLAREVGRVGVNVNAIAPGFIDTEMTGGLEGSERERVIGRSALRRLAAAGGHRCDGGVSDGRGRTQHHRRGDDGGRGGHGIVFGCSPTSALFRLLARHSKTHSPVSDRFVAVRIERDIGLSLAFEDVKRIFNALRVEALLDINAPLRFEGLRGVDLAGEAQEQRPGVSRQSFEPPDERVEIELSVDLQQRHSRAPVGAGNRNPVDDRFRHAGTSAEDPRDFERGDVLALPAKCVADAIDERIEAVGVATHEVAGSHPSVARA